MRKNSPPLGHAALKDKQRLLREIFPTELTLRVHRGLSWFGRASEETDDSDVRFILLWIAFNASYASEIDADLGGDREQFRLFFRTLVQLDAGNRIYNIVWSRFPSEVRLLLDNRYVFAPFWAHQNGVPGTTDWEARLSRAKHKANSAMTSQDTPLILSILFDRLYVLRNQLVHGGSTWCSSVNRDQVRDGAALLGHLVPVFLDIMMDNPQHAWGMPFYPVIAD
ncbi:HEPN domain-containing protein [Sphingomonas swuensis]|uniref:HEPN domain-containing protein n=1 Tax=Sphingomonas swuensis TaxID=977800 RepID=A0ABP7T2A1_9SPHN